MNVTSQDVLNLSIAFANINQNRNIENGYIISKMYRNKILEALEISCKKYINQVKESEN